MLCEEAITEFLGNLKNAFKSEPSEDGCILVTPFLRPDNTSIELSLSRDDSGRFIITDNGDTIDSLFICGLNIGSKRFKERTRIISHRYGVTIKEGAISLTSTENIGEGLLSLIGAIQDVSYLIYNRVQGNRSGFDEKVEKLLIEKYVPYQYDYTISGSKDSHSFRFFVNHRHNLAIQPFSINNLNRAELRAQAFAYHIQDIQKATSQYHFMAIIDDSTDALSSIWSQPEVTKPLEYCDLVLRWSNQQEVAEKLSALQSYP